MKKLIISACAYLGAAVDIKHNNIDPNDVHESSEWAAMHKHQHKMDKFTGFT